MLADLLAGDDAQIAATLAVIAAASADVLVLQDIDFDAEGAALLALIRRLEGVSQTYPHHLTLRPNTGWPTGVDLDGNGRSTDPRDAHGFGRFNGDGGMAILSRHPITRVHDFSNLHWVDPPGNSAARFTPPEALDHLRLQEVAAWVAEIALPDGAFQLLVGHASAPVFDGPEDRNGWRNADQLRFWMQLLDGWRPEGTDLDLNMERLALIATLNVDPNRGEGHQTALGELLMHPALQDVVPESSWGTATADWADPTPGNLRVDYILPARGLDVVDHGVLWPEGEGDGPLPLSIVEEASDHRLIWIDLRL